MKKEHNVLLTLEEHPTAENNQDSVDEKPLDQANFHYLQMKIVAIDVKVDCKKEEDEVHSQRRMIGSGVGNHRFCTKIPRCLSGTSTY